MLQEPIFYIITSEKCPVVQLPPMWFQDISVNESNKKLTISYFKLGRYNSNYQRTLEKQLIITQGKVTIYF